MPPRDLAPTIKVGATTFYLYADQQYHKTPPLDTRLPDALPERPSTPPLDKAAPHEERRRRRLAVRITRHSCRTLDFDNGAGGCKALCDQLRYQGLIPDDTPEDIDFQFCQVKVHHKNEEGTLIEIEPITVPNSAQRKSRYHE